MGALKLEEYISNAFEERQRWIAQTSADPKSAYYVAEKRARYGITEDRYEYTSENIFWVSKEARWSFLKNLDTLIHKNPEALGYGE